MSYLATHLDIASSIVSIPSAFSPYEHKNEHKNEQEDEHKNEINEHVRRQLLSNEDEVPIPPASGESQDQEEARAALAEARAPPPPQPAEARTQPPPQAAKEAKDSYAGDAEQEHNMELRSGSSRASRPLAFRNIPVHLPQGQRNTSPNWLLVKRALGHESLDDNDTAIQPSEGWTLENTRTATRHAHHCIIGNGTVLHHPECRQLRGYGGVYAHNTYVVAPYLDSSPQHGYRYPIVGGCCYNLWSRSPNKAMRLNHIHCMVRSPCGGDRLPC